MSQITEINYASSEPDISYEVSVKNSEVTIQVKDFDGTYDTFTVSKERAKVIASELLGILSE